MCEQLAQGRHVK